MKEILSGRPVEAMPHRIAPMDMVESREVVDQEDWFYEVKWDGFRAIAEVEEGKVSLHSKKQNSFNESFPKIARSLTKIGTNMILDGEIIVIDEHGKPNFELIRSRKGRGDGIAVYCVFDLLYIDRYNIMNLPLYQRKEILKEALPDLPYVKYADHVRSGGIAFFRTIQEMGLEGAVVKDPESIYQPGIRTNRWIKVKNYVRHGWTKQVQREI